MTAPWWWACECGKVLGKEGDTLTACTHQAWKIIPVSPAIAAALKQSKYFEEAGIEAQRERDAALRERERLQKQLGDALFSRSEREQHLIAALEKIASDDCVLDEADAERLRCNHWTAKQALAPAAPKAVNALCPVHGRSVNARDYKCCCAPAPKAERCPECSSVLVDGRCPYPQHAPAPKAVRGGVPGAVSSGDPITDVQAFDAPAPKAECCPKCAGPNRYGDSCIEDCECHEPPPVPGGERCPHYPPCYPPCNCYCPCNREQRGGRSAGATPAGGEKEKAMTGPGFDGNDAGFVPTLEWFKNRQACGTDEGARVAGFAIKALERASTPPPPGGEMEIPRLYPHESCTTGCLLCRLEFVESVALSAIDQLQDPYGKDEPDRHWKEALATLRRIIQPAPPEAKPEPFNASRHGLKPRSGAKLICDQNLSRSVVEAAKILEEDDPPKPLTHEDSENCWCSPRVEDYTHIGGTKLIIHNGEQ